MVLTMKIIEFFCGTKSVSKVFISRPGYKTLTIDNDERHNPDICKDILNITIDDIPKEFRNPDVVWASPPCQTFSVAAIHYHWKNINGNLHPRSERAKEAHKLVKHTIDLIRQLKPKYWFIENPRGMLRKMPYMKVLPRHTVTYCQYGDKRQKPTDIWTNCQVWTPRRMCRPKAPCHEAAPRQIKNTGTQGLKNAIERAVIPAALCEEICAAIEAGKPHSQTRLKKSIDR